MFHLISVSQDCIGMYKKIITGVLMKDTRLWQKLMSALDRVKNNIKNTDIFRQIVLLVCNKASKECRLSLT